MRFLSGVFVTSLALIAFHIWGSTLLEKLFSRGDDDGWQDVCKQPSYKQMTKRLPNE